MAKISVLVPVYNVEEYLRECLDSILRQTLADLEIICLNDGSTDRSREILQEYADKDSRIKIIDKANSGYGHTMNIGLRAATGKYVGIVESDDFINANMFETLWQVAEANSVDVAKSDFYIHVDGSDYYNPTIAPKFYHQIISGATVPDVFYGNSSIWSNLYRRGFLLANDIWFNETPGASFQDISFRFKVFACAERVYFLRKAFLHYRRDNVNASVTAGQKIYCVCDEYKEIYKFAEAHGKLEKFRYLIESLKFGHYHWNFSRRSLSWPDRITFLGHMAKEFAAAAENGLIKREFWLDIDWKTLQAILNDRHAYLAKYFAEEQQKDMLVAGFCQHIHRYQHIAIYGTDNMERMIALDLRHLCMAAASFVVDDTSGKPPKLLDIPVRSLNDLHTKKKYCVVLALVTTAKQKANLEKLYRLGFENVIAIDTALANALQDIRIL